MSAAIEGMKAEVARLREAVASLEAAMIASAETLEERDQLAQAVKDANQAASSRAVSVFHRTRLEYLESVGEGESLFAQWIRAWLRDEHYECRRLLDLMYPRTEAQGADHAA